MINRKKTAVFILLAIFIIACLFLIFRLAQKEHSAETIQSSENLTHEDLTLLERMYADVDGDGNDESIELYTSAKIAPDGRMGWDTGHQWVLLVRKGEEIFPLFDDWVQYGELLFWVVSFNKDKIIGPKSTDLERHIYVMNSTFMRLYDYYWDKQNCCYKKEVVFDPPNQWEVRHSNKYSIPDPFRIESEK